jgi:predicted nucleic acid-binding protein
MPAGELKVAITTFDGDLRESFDIVELDEPVMERAAAMARKHGLRGADAIQLACAVLARSDMPSAELVLLSCDAELNAAASAEGLRVEDPNPHP